MRVTSAKVFGLGGNLDSAIRNSRLGWSKRRGVLLVLSDELGNKGVGEASPLPGYSPDTFTDALEYLGSLPIDNFDFEEAPEIIGYSLGMWRESSAPPSALFALETALLDLASKRSKVPLWKAIGGGRKWNGTIGINCLLEYEVDRDTLMSRMDRGLRAFKIKVGHSDVTIDEEVAYLERLRGWVGSEVELRLDANGAFDLEEAKKRLDGYTRIAPAFIEEPVTGEDLLELRDSPIPIAADEALARRDMAEKLVSDDAISVVVLKPALLGGIARCLELGDLAAKAGKGVVVTHMFDGPVALLACAHTAFSMEAKPMACGLQRHSGLDIWPPVLNWAGFDRGEIYPPSRPGVGLAPDDVLGG